MIFNFTKLVLSKCEFKSVFAMAILALSGLCQVAVSQEAKDKAVADKIPVLKFDETFSGEEDAELPAMKKLLGLKLEAEMLKLRRDWDNVTDDWNERWQKQRIIRRRFHGDDPKPKNVSVAFRNAGMALGCGGIGGSVSATTPRMSCTGTTHFCSINGYNKGLKFVFGRNIAPSEQFVLEELNDGKLIINFSREADVVQIYQAADKKTHIAYVIDGQPGKITADSFGKLFNGQPQVVDRILKPLFDHMGIGTPLHYGSMEIREYVAQRLISKKSTSEVEFEELVTGLSAARFETREHATEMLKGGIAIWKENMQAYVADESNPIEPRMRLKQIIETSELPDSSSIVQFVASHNLLKSQDYLFSLLPDASNELHEAVFLQLEKIQPDKNRTKLEKEYRDWLKKSGK